MENNDKTIGIIRSIVTLISVFIAAAALIVCTYLFTRGFVDYKSNNNGGLSATGSASVDFEADLIVWRGTYSAYAETTSEAYDRLNRDADKIRRYLNNNDIKAEDVVFSAIDINRRYNSNYNDEGNYVGETFAGYELYQTVTVSSEDVDNVEKISRDITELIEDGVEFTSNSPEYYYKDLDSLKLELVEAATENARNRIDLMAKGSGCEVGKLMSSNLGVFQITAKNSADDEYSYGGTYNTSSRHKTATITVKLNYAVK
ncbi:MAG: SIMPL domain-containing protein [Lachnospiraceae bacterium]|nr:SIMPL domain-containing protein [Lachnospiraceae bacterium]